MREAHDTSLGLKNKLQNNVSSSGCRLVASNGVCQASAKCFTLFSSHSELTRKGLLDCLFSEEEFEAQRLSDFLNSHLANRHWAQDVTRSP